MKNMSVAPKTWPATQEAIKAVYPSMSKRLQQVAAYVLENPSAAAFDTIAVIANRMDVPPSTLIRFSSAIGFSGFNELKSILKEHMLENTRDYSSRIQLIRDRDSTPSGDLLSRFAKANREAIKRMERSVEQRDVQRAVDLLDQAGHIFVLGNGRAHTVAVYLHYMLNHIDKKVFLIDGSGNMFNEQMSNIDPGDLLIAISYSPYSSNTCALAKETTDRGITVVSITDSPVSPLATCSSLAFTVYEARVDAFRSLTSSLLLAQILAINLADHRSHKEERIEG